MIRDTAVSAISILNFQMSLFVKICKRRKGINEVLKNYMYERTCTVYSCIYTWFLNNDLMKMMMSADIRAFIQNPFQENTGNEMFIFKKILPKAIIE